MRSFEASTAARVLEALWAEGGESTMPHEVPIKRVLIAIDFTDASRRAFYAGIDVANRLDVEEIYVLHVSEPIRAFDFSKKRYVETRETIERVEEGVRRRLDELWKEGGLEKVDRRKIKLWVRGGRADEEILATAEAKKIDLIVIGSASFDDSSSNMGSTAEKVTRNARCSVICIRPQPEFEDPEQP